MELKLITEEDFNYYYSLLEQDFCFAERRSKEDELKSLYNERFKPCFILENNKIVGYFCYWIFDNFIFGEHFAILKEIRDKGIGTKFLAEHLKSINKPFIFEIENPIDETSIRRERFYKQFKLYFNDFKYFQPPYHADSKPIEMIVVSYPNKLTEIEFKKMKEIIYKYVYKLN